MTCTCSLARPNTFSVVSPCNTSRKCPPKNCMRSHCCLFNLSASLPIKIIKNGIKGYVNSRIQPIQDTELMIAIDITRGINTAYKACGIY